MTESSYERRVKALYEKQIHMEALEAKFIKKVFKFNSNLCELEFISIYLHFNWYISLNILVDVKEAASRHQRKVGKLQKVLMERREELDKRVSFIEELDRELEATKLHNLAMKDWFKQQKMLAKQRKNEIMERSAIRSKIIILRFS